MTATAMAQLMSRAKSPRCGRKKEKNTERSDLWNLFRFFAFKSSTSLARIFVPFGDGEGVAALVVLVAVVALEPVEIDPVQAEQAVQLLP